MTASHSSSVQHWLFPPFRLDPLNHRLWRTDHVVPLRRKSFALLCYLVEHAGRLVSHEEMLRTLWPGTYVSEGLLRGYIHELRHVLGDDVATPRFIKTVVRRGYQFIAPVTVIPRVPSSDVHGSNGQSVIGILPSAIVGREAELACLQDWLAQALAGVRQLVFVTGEPGIGKTTVVDAFLRHAGATDNVWSARGQCLEHCGVGEAYLPVLDALGRLCREPEGERLLGVLQQYAPSWVAQMPALLDEAVLAALQGKIDGVTPERMLREMVDTLEAFTCDTPLVLVLEDLQWADAATLDLIALLAQRRGPARLLVLGTYRPADVFASGHPLKRVKQELQVHEQCVELPLGFLTPATVREYLAARFADHDFPADFGVRLHETSDGNPLFMVNVVDELVAQEALTQVAGRWRPQVPLEDALAAVPESVQQLIEQQTERLPEAAQQVLAAASVAGRDFSVAHVAVAVDEEVEQVEEQCAQLVRHTHLLQARGTETLTDGTVTGRYRFGHALYQRVLYARPTEAQRARLHRRIGESTAAAYGARAGEIAAELAMHFERGLEYRRAVEYHRQAAHNALRRGGHRETRQHLDTALALLWRLPDTPERSRQELMLRVALGVALAMVNGYIIPDVEKAYTRAYELCIQLGDSKQRPAVLFGLWMVAVVRGRFRSARRLAEEMLCYAQRQNDAAMLAEAHTALGSLLVRLGKLAAGHAYLEQGMTLAAARPGDQALLYAQDPQVTCRAHKSLALWLLGYPEQALQNVQELLVQVQAPSHSYSEAFARHRAVLLHQCRGEVAMVQEQAEAAIRLAGEHGFTVWRIHESILLGWALTAQGQKEDGHALMRRNLADWQALRTEVSLYYLVLAADSYRMAGQPGHGLVAVAEGLKTAERTGERFCEAELYRLKGELMLLQSSKPKVRKRKSRKAKSR